MAYAKRTDNNQKDIVEALRACGVSVFDTSGVGQGFTDLVCGIHGVTYLAEVKNGERKWKMEPKQKTFHAEWRGSTPLIFTCVEDVFIWIKQINKRGAI